MTNSIQKWVNPSILSMAAYHVPEPSGAIKLDSMENPYQWDADLQQAWLNHLKTAELNRYPDAGTRVLKRKLRRVMQVPDTMDIVLGNGSDEILFMLQVLINGDNRSVLAPEPSFAMYRLNAQCLGLQYLGVPLLADDFRLDLPAMLTAIEQHQPALVFLAYPNNPTANVFADPDLEAIIEASPGLVVIDEAYTPFTDHSFMSRLENYANVVVVRTLSKLGLAGIRLGMLIGSQAWLEQIEKVRLPYNINVMSQLTAEFALQHFEVFEQQTQRIRQDRTSLLSALQALPNIHAWPSQTNFILFRVPNAPQVFESIRQQGVLIKCFDGKHPLLKDCLRVTVGTPEENQAFLNALQTGL